MTHIMTYITEAIELDLSEATEDTEDEAEVTLVQEGRLQEDPEDLGISVQVIGNDPEHPGVWVHERFKPPQAYPGSELNVLSGFYEIGGGDAWIRRLTVKIKVYLTRQDKTLTQAQEIMYTVLGRCENAIRSSTRLSSLSDEWGESVSGMSKFGIAKSEMLVRGGPPTDWIGEGTIWVEIYTERR